MRFRIFSSAALLSLHALAGPPSRIAGPDYYQRVIQECCQRIPGEASPVPAPTSPVSRFTNQGFILWDYLIGVHTDADCVTHFTNLTTLCTERNIQKLILFIPSPSLPSGASKFEFFQPNSTLSQNFVSMLGSLTTQMRSLPSSPNFSVSVFFEYDGFNSRATAPSFTSPYTSIESPLPSSRLPGYFNDLDKMLDWAAFMINQNIGITQFAFDPQGVGSNGTTADKNAQQLIYNYSDNYRYAHGLSYTDPGSGEEKVIEIGVTLGVDESKESFANTTSFPVNSVYTSTYASGVFPTPKPAYRQINSQLPTEDSLNAPLLQNVYIQVYQSNIPSIFNTSTGGGAHDANLSANRLNSLFRDQPYLDGTGVITCSKGNPVVTGSHGSNFLAFKDSDGFFFTVAEPPKKIGIVGSVESDTKLTFSFGPTIDLTQSKYQRCEIVTGWPTQLDITQETVDKLVFMFSVNYDPTQNLNFFGNWNLSDFMDFIEDFTAKSQATPIFPGFKFPANFAIYDNYFLNTTVNNTPSIPWDVAEPPDNN